LKILVVDDHALVREGLCQVLKGLDEAILVLQAATCSQAFDLADGHPDLDLVLLDYHLPDMTGLAAIDVLGQKHPELPVIILSGSANSQVMRQALGAGASGFVTKSSMSDELLTAVREVLAGGIYHQSPPAQTTGHAPGAASAGNKLDLTHRQVRVLTGLLDGKANREIADEMKVSEETVKSHVAAILRHFDAQNRTQAVVSATRAGYRPSHS